MTFTLYPRGFHLIIPFYKRFQFSILYCTFPYENWSWPLFSTKTAQNFFLIPILSFDESRAVGMGSVLVDGDHVPNEHSLKTVEQILLIFGSFVFGSNGKLMNK